MILAQGGHNMLKESELTFTLRTIACATLVFTAEL
jgi:hypothetical protein